MSLNIAFVFQMGASATEHSNTEVEEDADRVTTPVIPKPKFLPGPDKEITETGAGTQDYILNTTIPRIINIIIALLAIAAFIGIIVASINMLTAFGNEDKYNRSKNNLKYTIYGFLLVILSYAIVSIIVSVSLPSDDDNRGNSFIPSAYAVNVEKDLDILFPKESDIIQDQGEGREVSLPSGDFLTEIIPAAIVNIFYFVGLLVFIAFTVAGVLLIAGRGNEEMLTKAKRIVTYSAVAIALLALGYAIIFGIATLNLTQDKDDATEIKDDTFELFGTTDENN